MDAAGNVLRPGATANALRRQNPDPPLVSLHNEVLRFCDLVCPTPDERVARASVVDDSAAC